MAKFKISLELQGLKLNIEGERDDIPLLSRAVAAQIAGQIMPGAGIAEGKVPAALATPGVIEGQARVVESAVPTRRSKRKPSASNRNGDAVSVALAWNHDVATWGNPLQSWNTADKSLWLLYVASKSGVATEMTSNQIAETFNKMFRQAGQIRAFNVTRDLGKLKGQPPAKVSDDATKEPPAWYLTDTGVTHAAGLVAAARGDAQS